MLPPLPRRSDWVPRLLASPAVSTFPDRVSGSVCASTFSRLARRSLALRPAHSRCHQFVTCISRRLQPFRYLHSCSGSFRLEHLPGGTCTHWKTPPCHGAHPKPPVAVGSRTGAPTLGSGGCSTAFAVALSPAAMVTFPAPAASNVACEFLALRSPVRFVPKLMDLFDRDDFPQITT